MVKTKQFSPRLGVVALALATMCMMLLAAQRLTEDVLIREKGMDTATVYIGALVALLVAVAAIAIFFFRPFVQTVSSFRFACFLMLVITVFTIMGTLVVQTERRVEFQEQYGGWFIARGWWDGGSEKLQADLKEIWDDEAKSARMESDPFYNQAGQAFDLLSKLQLNDVYHAWWYDGLLALLMLGAIFSVVTRYSRSTRKFGFVLTHCSLAVILAGSLVGDHFGATKGYLLLYEGQTRSHFLPNDRGQNKGAGIPLDYLKEPVRFGVPTTKLPYEITLHDFEKKNHPQNFKLYYLVEEKEGKDFRDRIGKPQPVWAKKTDPVQTDVQDTTTGLRKLVGTDYSVIVRRFFWNPVWKNGERYENVSDEPLNPQAKIIYQDPASGDQTIAFLEALSVSEREAHLPQGRARIVFQWSDPRKKNPNFAKSVPSFEPMSGTLEVVLKENGNKKVEVPFVLGNEVRVGDSDYYLKIARYEPDFQISGRKLGSKSDQPRNQAVLIEVYRKQGDTKTDLDPKGKGVWRFLNTPDEWFEVKRRNVTLPIEIRLRKATHWTGFRNTYMIVGETQRVLLLRDAKVIEEKPVKAGKPITFDSSPARLLILSIMADASLNINPQDKGPVEVDGVLTINPLVIVDLLNDKTGRWHKSVLLWGLDEQWRWVDSTLAVRFKPQDVMPAAFRSTVTIRKDGKIIRDHVVIRMNHPLILDGFGLFQSDWGPKTRPRTGLVREYSVFQVVRDPGVPIVYIGFLAMVVGLLLMLVIDPWLKKRRSNSPAASAESATPAAPGSNGGLDAALFGIGIVLLGILVTIVWSTLGKGVAQNNLERSHVIFKTMLCLSSAAALAYILNGFFFKSRWFGRFGSLLFLASFGANTAFLVHGWIEADHAPINTFFTVSTLVSWMIMLSYSLFELFTRAKIVGSIASIAAAGMQFFALGKFDPEYSPVPPSLNSAWFVPHVCVYTFGYSMLAVAAFAAFFYLLTPKVKTLTAKNANVFGGVHVSLERYAYKAVTFGFIFLTCGLFSGAWWAAGAWGDYWFWDPKETWGLISWLIFLVFLHLRRVRGWAGKKAMIFCLVGVLAIAVTYFAMAYLPSAKQSVHIYTGD